MTKPDDKALRKKIMKDLPALGNAIDRLIQYITGRKLKFSLLIVTGKGIDETTSYLSNADPDMATRSLDAVKKQLAEQKHLEKRIIIGTKPRH